MIIYLLISIIIIILIFWIIRNFYYKLNDLKITNIVNKIKDSSNFDELKPLQLTIDEDINEILADVRNPDIRMICEYAVADGKRMRPVIGYSIIKNLNPKINKTIRKIISNIELLHNSSLIIDDIMDKDKYRRNKLSVPYKYGTNIAQLTSAELLRLFMKSCFDSLMEIQKDKYYAKNKETIVKLMSNVLSNNMEDLIIGQYYDLLNKNNSKSTEIIDKKTGSIYRMIFVCSWILSKPNNLQNIDEIEKIAKYFGIMFQIYDDFTDYFSDISSGKYNYVAITGIHKSHKIFKRYYLGFVNLSKKYNIYTKEIQLITDYLNKTVESIYKFLTKNENLYHSIIS